MAFKHCTIMSATQIQTSSTQSIPLSLDYSEISRPDDAISSIGSHSSGPGKSDDRSSVYRSEKGNNMNTKSSSTSHSSHREVHFGAYILGSTLGEGEFGKVKLGWRKDGKHPSQVAIKLIKRDTLARDAELEVKIHREINSMRLLSHPNIINLVEVLKSGKYIGIVLEYVSGGELFEYILQHKHLKENVAKRLFAQLVSGVDYMHLKGLIHRDLKLENLLLDKHKNIVISDFGFVNSYNRAKNDLMKTSCGLPCYAAPELVLTKTPYSGRKVDIWSMGVILYAMLAGYLPFDDDVENEDGADIVRLYSYICFTRLTFPDSVSPLARDLLRRIIVPDPSKRIGIDEIRNHPWLAQHASLLSNRQPEWDRMAQDKKMLGAASVGAGNCGQNRNKRYSMILEPSSSSALMLGRSKNTYGRSYAPTSTIIYSNPTTSASLANVVATSSESKGIEAQHQRVSSVTTENYLLSNQLGHHKGHARSASIPTAQTSASFALKAVVSEHDRSSDTEQPPSLSQSVTPVHLSRNSTHIGAVTTIAESPTAAEFGTATRGLSTPLERLPHTQTRTRPTSYHPGSMSLSYNSYNTSNSTVPDYIKGQIQGSGSPYGIYLGSCSPTRTLHRIDSAISISENGNSSPILPTTISGHRPSRRDSVVTAINVNGVLSSDVVTHENERNSVLSYLEDKIDVLGGSELHSPGRVPLDDSDLPAIRNDPQIPKLQTSLPHPTTVTPKIEHLPKFVTSIESPELPQSEILQLSKKVEKATVEEKAPVEQKVTVEQKPTVEQKTTLEQKAEPNLKNSEVVSENPSNKTPEKLRSKETEKMKNRFSILSFYGTTSLSAYNIAGIDEVSAGKEAKKAKESTENRAIEPGRGPSQHRRPMSMISPSTNAAANNKETSTARKVMNFFKRRSVRIG